LSDSQNEGIVIRVHGGHHYVQADNQVIDCSLRGLMKRTRAAADLVVIGDRVRWEPTDEGAGVITQVLPRRSTLSRRPPAARAQRAQVLVANPDLAVVVFSFQKPVLSTFMLDRYLVACEAVPLPVVMVINKLDLASTPEDHEAPALYRRIGYTVRSTNALTGEGLEPLRAELHGKLSIFTGPSGVGKSSLLNALWPELALLTGEISEYHAEGTHTTVVARLLEPEPGTYVADTPGLREFELWDIDPEQLDYFFPEMRPFLGQCHFKPCTHTHEPRCAVKAAVARGEIAAVRYESYLKLFG